MRVSLQVFQPLDIRAKADLSVMLKIDIEGDEWDVLASFSANDLKKILTLDMEIHWSVLRCLEKRFSIENKARHEPLVVYQRCIIKQSTASIQRQFPHHADLGLT